MKNLAVCLYVRAFYDKKMIEKNIIVDIDKSRQNRYTSVFCFCY